jgi:hypothetical protein
MLSKLVWFFLSMLAIAGVMFKLLRLPACVLVCGGWMMSSFVNFGFAAGVALLLLLAAAHIHWADSKNTWD